MCYQVQSATIPVYIYCAFLSRNNTITSAAKIMLIRDDGPDLRGYIRGHCNCVLFRYVRQVKNADSCGCAT